MAYVEEEKDAGKISIAHVVNWTI